MLHATATEKGGFWPLPLSRVPAFSFYRNHRDFPRLPWINRGLCDPLGCVSHACAKDGDAYPLPRPAHDVCDGGVAATTWEHSCRLGGALNGVPAGDDGSRWLKGVGVGAICRCSGPSLRPSLESQPGLHSPEPVNCTPKYCACMREWKSWRDNATVMLHVGGLVCDRSF